MFLAEANEFVDDVRRWIARASHQIDAGAGEQRRAEHRRNPLVRLIGRRLVIDEDETELASEEFQRSIAAPLKPARAQLQLRIHTSDVRWHVANEGSFGVVFDEIIDAYAPVGQPIVDGIGDRRRESTLPHVEISGEDVPDAERPVRIEVHHAGFIDFFFGHGEQVA